MHTSADENARTGRREDEILAAAERAFAAHGYAGASMRQIADELGLLKGSLYHYVRSKEELLFRLLAGTQEELTALARWASALELPAEERLRAYVRRRALLVSERPARLALYYHDAHHLTPAHQQWLATARERETQLLSRLIARTGTALDPRIAALAMRDGAYWLFRWAPPGEGPDPASLADAYATLLLGGLARTPA